MSSSAQMLTGFASVPGSATLLGNLYNVGDEVYIKSEYSTTGQTVQTQNPYTVTRVQVAVTNAGGDYLDANGAIADATAVVSVSTTGTGDDTSPLWPVFYELQNNAKPTVKTIIHESLVLNLAGVIAERVANPWV